MSDAVEQLRRAAANGHANAAFELGVACCTGDGTPRDVTEGARLYAAAGAAGHKVAMFNWGVMLRDGVGVEADEESGRKWIARAAEAGLTEARLVLESGR